MKRAPPLKIGELFQSQFEIRRLLGTGGYGFVYHAYNRMMARDVALKLIEVPTRDRQRRACIEAQVTDRLSHPNIVRGYGGGVWNESWIYLEMELLHGRSLAQALQEHKTISLLEAFSIATQIAEGVHTAHVARIIHRDLKPDNIFLERDNFVRVIDFGVAKLQGTDSPTTQRDLVHGTGLYMCPEQLLTGEVTVRSDIFSLGVILYEICYGRCPALVGLETEDLRLMTENQILRIPPALHELMNWVPPYAGRLVQRLIAKNPDDRIQSMDEVAAALRAAAERLRSHSDPRVSTLRNLSVTGDAPVSRQLVRSKPTTVAERRGTSSNALTQPIAASSSAAEGALPTDPHSEPRPVTFASHIAPTVPLKRFLAVSGPASPRVDSAALRPGDAHPERVQPITAPAGSPLVSPIGPSFRAAEASAGMPTSTHDSRPDLPTAARAPEPPSLELAPQVPETPEPPGVTLEHVPRANDASHAKAASIWGHLGVTDDRRAARAGVVWGALMGLAAGLSFLAFEHKPTRIFTTHAASTAASQPSTAVPATELARPGVPSIPPSVSASEPVAPVATPASTTSVTHPALVSTQRPSSTRASAQQTPSQQSTQVAGVAKRLNAKEPTVPPQPSIQAPPVPSATKSWIVVRKDDEGFQLPSSGLGNKAANEATPSPRTESAVEKPTRSSAVKP